MCISFLNLLFIFKLVSSYDSTPPRLEYTSNAFSYSNRSKRQDVSNFQFIDCVLPRYPDNGKYEVINGNGRPGQTILPNTLIQFSCDHGYWLEPEEQYFFCDVDWNPAKMPKCAGPRFCPRPPKSPSPSTTIVKCYDRYERTEVDCEIAENHSVAKSICAPYYEIEGHNSFAICTDYIWSPDKIGKCFPACGSAVNQTNVPIIPGKDENIISYPWTVLIFGKNGGSHSYSSTGVLISPRTVILAAHSLGDDSGVADKKFIIAAGKFYRSYGDPRDMFAQYVAVDRIIKHPDFNRSNFKSDIALMITKRPFRLSELVQPICIRGLDVIGLEDGDTGIIASWGFNKNSESDDIRYFNVTKNDAECLKKLSEKWTRNIYMEDKICAPVLAGYSFCSRSSGNGWAFKNRYTYRYYLHGISATGPVSDITFCEDGMVYMYTNITHYFEFIVANMVEE